MSEIESLRGTMKQVAEQRCPLPERFSVSQDGNGTVITDGDTGREVRVPLYAYSAVRETLARLFGDPVVVAELILRDEEDRLKGLKSMAAYGNTDAHSELTQIGQCPTDEEFVAIRLSNLSHGEEDCGCPGACRC